MNDATRRLLSAGAGAGMVDLCAKLTGLALGVLMARALGTNNYGVYSFVMSLIALLLIPAKFGLPDLMMREVAAATVDDKRCDIRHLLWWATKMVLAIAAIVMVVGYLLVGALGILATPLREVAFSVGLWLLPALALLSVYSAALLSLGRVTSARLLENILPNMIVLGTFSLVVLWSTLEATPQALLAIRLAATWLSVIAAALLVRNCLRKISGDRSGYIDFRYFLSEAVPFTLIGGANIILARMDVVMLGAFKENTEVGIYSVAVQGAIIVSLALNAANTVIAPEFAKHYAEGDLRTLQKVAISSANLVLVISFVVLAVLYFSGRNLIDFAFGPEYAPAYEPLMILAVGQFVSMLFGTPGALLNMTGHQRLSMKILFVAALMNAALNLILIPKFGPIGAALATTITLILWKCSAFLLVRRRLGINCAACSWERAI